MTMLKITMMDQNIVMVVESGLFAKKKKDESPFWMWMTQVGNKGQKHELFSFAFARHLILMRRMQLWMLMT